VNFTEVREQLHRKRAELDSGDQVNWHWYNFFI
jgi:hypothetical protein